MTPAFFGPARGKSMMTSNLTGARQPMESTRGLAADTARAFPVPDAVVPSTRRRSLMRRVVLAVSVVLTVVLGVTWSGVLAQQEAIKIGVIQPLTGPVAASGNYVRIGAEIARDWINARGGVNGRQIQLLIEDNKSDPKEAASAAEKLIVRDKVPVIMGAWGSSMTLAAMPKLEEYGVPMVVETSSAASITKRGNPWIFRISPPSEMEALGLDQYVG